MSSAYTSAEAGDVYMYDWGRGEGWSQVSIETGWGTFANWSDNGKAYSSVTGGSGDYINQHTTDRWHSPWNWGYWTETSPTIRASIEDSHLALQYVSPRSARVPRRRGQSRFCMSIRNVAARAIHSSGEAVSARSSRYSRGLSPSGSSGRSCDP